MQNSNRKEIGPSNYCISSAPYLHALKALVNSLLTNQNVPEETSDVLNTKSKSLGEVEGSLWNARAKITELKKKLDVILKSIDEGFSFIMGLNINMDHEEKKAGVDSGRASHLSNLGQSTNKPASGGPIPGRPTRPVNVFNQNSYFPQEKALGLVTSKV